MIWIKYACGMCIPLSKLSKMPKIIKIGVKSYSRFSAERSVTGRWREKRPDAGFQRPVSTCASGPSVRSVFLACPEATEHWESPVSDDWTRPIAENVAGTSL